ncbi:MAG TPA: Asp23/Gls24 family envelope stress response protein [Candidatus Anaerostipes avistercoris]|uniref:Asp23/Gls24 family envelope stress response protein n=1 Tax=Candidatus Anaerostipes avistercoris TaxID=2838462 RepID=A0A9D2PH27_9FIRM|nr:Asp23/Gls24 family envelope stress response protein [uncultured Anaerostipes sp.]HJC49946.1 Asp23/Gls24 family envelope stress response protein [Candidatus Anaerostipes avistercoris]
MENRNGYKIKEKGIHGDVKIADDVIAIIAALAATEVSGVARMCGNITNELVSKLGMQKLSKGVRVKIDNDRIIVDLALELEYGVNIPKVSSKVQERVKTAIENMTGLEVGEVNVRIAGVAMDDE